MAATVCTAFRKHMGCYGAEIGADGVDTGPIAIDLRFVTTRASTTDEECESGHGKRG